MRTKTIKTSSYKKSFLSISVIMVNLNPFSSKVKRLIEAKDTTGLQNLLAANPTLANKGITIPYEPTCMVKAHPLHRICDPVMSGKLSDDKAVEIAKIFLSNGANVDGDKNKGEGTPLLAAASLHAEKTGILYIEQGADIHYTYKNDGATALHWAAFCGSDKLLATLIEHQAVIDMPDKTYNSTPLAWAVHTLMGEDTANKRNQAACIKLLLRNGADPRKLGKDQYEFLKLNYAL